MVLLSSVVVSAEDFIPPILTNPNSIVGKMINFTDPDGSMWNFPVVGNSIEKIKKVEIYRFYIDAGVRFNGHPVESIFYVAGSESGWEISYRNEKDRLHCDRICINSIR